MGGTDRGCAFLLRRPLSWYVHSGTICSCPDLALKPCRYEQDMFPFLQNGFPLSMLWDLPISPHPMPLRAARPWTKIPQHPLLSSVVLEFLRSC